MLICSEMFKDGLELCTTSAEFLLNPWVLLQLQWNPVLLLQWTAGVLVEFYTFRLELVELYRWYLPHNLTLTTVKKLFKLLHFFHVNSYRVLSHLTLYFRSISMQCGCQITSDFMNLVNHGIVPLLEFVTSGKARDIVRALKRISFGSNYRSNTDNYTATFIHYEWESTYNSIFSDHFWHQGKYEDLIGPAALEKDNPSLVTDGFRFLLASEEFIVKATPEWISEMETKHGKEIEATKVQKALNSKLCCKIQKKNSSQLLTTFKIKQATHIILSLNLPQNMQIIK
jgi:hypothetical protein